MENEKRLIDAADTEKRLSKKVRFGRIEYEDALSVIADAPTVDAVEVVRCKDCKCGKHPEMTSLVGKYVKCALYNPMPMMRGSDFCSYGERRTDDGHS